MPAHREDRERLNATALDIRIGVVIRCQLRQDAHLASPDRHPNLISQRSMRAHIAVPGGLDPDAQRSEFINQSAHHKTSPFCRRCSLAPKVLTLAE